MGLWQNPRWFGAAGRREQLDEHISLTGTARFGNRTFQENQKARAVMRHFNLARPPRLRAPQDSTRHSPAPRRRTALRLLLLALIAAVVALPLTGCVVSARTGPGHHRIGVGVEVRVPMPPPPLRHEVVVARPGPGWVWVPGHYDWHGHRRGYVWVPGRWLRPPQAGAVWVAPHHEHRADVWIYISGHWRL